MSCDIKIEIDMAEEESVDNGELDVLNIQLVYLFFLLIATM